MKINHYVINLDRSPDRLAAIREDAKGAGLELIRVPAVDGRAVPVAERTLLDEAGFRRDHGKIPQPGEFGCYASHVHALQTFLDSDADMATIFEDDVQPPEDFKEIVASIIAVDDWDLVKLLSFRMPMLVPSRPVHGGRRLGRALFGPTGSSAAYLLNRIGAERLLRGLQPMTLPYDVAFERGWAYGLRVRHVEPRAVRINQRTKASLITAEKQTYASARLKPWQRLTTLRFRAIDFVRRFSAAWNDARH